MKRAQIQLPESEHRRLKRWAQRLGISMSEAVRRCIGDRLDQEEAAPGREDLIRAALAACGRHRDPEGPRPLGRDHDEHLSDIYSR